MSVRTLLHLRHLRRPAVVQYARSQSVHHVHTQVMLFFYSRLVAAAQQQYGALFRAWLDRTNPQLILHGSYALVSELVSDGN